jgi:hypothetical protein
MTILLARIGAFQSAIVFLGCADYLIPTHEAQSAAAHAERERRREGAVRACALRPIFLRVWSCFDPVFGALTSQERRGLPRIWY